MGDWLSGLSTVQWVGLVIGVLVVLAALSGVLTALLVRLGLRTPWVIRRLNRLSEKAINLVKRPLTVAILDEVADVIRTGHYTQNVTAALIENRAELKALVAEKLREDPNVRLVARLPLYDRVVREASETTLRVVIQMLSDPRMDELVSDLLRNNLDQIKRAVRARANEDVEQARPPGSPASAAQAAS
jgi:hypothetical protein